MKKVKLFCIPYAGGSAMIYHRWKPFLSENIELCPIELAGRGRRIQERLYESMDDAVNDVYYSIQDQLDDSEYAVFGHSMGSIITYQIAHRLFQGNGPRPIHLFFSGRGAPHVMSENERVFHQMDEETFRSEVLELGGTPKEFFEHPELLQMLLPLLKNDFKVHETYQFDGETPPFDIAFTVLLGKDDELSAAQVHGWREHTSRVCTVQYFEGDHFFINSRVQEVVEVVNHTIANCLETELASSLLTGKTEYSFR